MPSKSTIWFIGGFVVSVIALLLLGWFLFLRNEQGAISEVLLGRGFSSSIPTFEGGATGSTNRNLRESLFEDFGFSSKTTSGAKEAEPDVFQTPRLWQVSGIPAAGVVAINKSLMGGASTTSPFFIQFVERPTGHIFEADPKTGSIARVSNTLIPNTQEASWAAEGQVLLRHLDDELDILTFSGRIEEATSTEGGGTKLAGQYLEPDIVSIATHPETEGVFSLIKTVSGVVGIIAGSDGNNAKRIFDSTLSGWRATRAGDFFVLTQNPSHGAMGSVYTLTEGGVLSAVVLNRPGLTAIVNSSNTAYLYGEAAGGTMRLFVSANGGSSQELFVATLADKCVFDPSQEFVVFCAVPNQTSALPMPDSWYRGETHFSDTWWKINTLEKSAEHIFSPESEFGVSLDVRDPYMNEGGTHIMFLDALTLTPWAFRITP